MDDGNWIFGGNRMDRIQLVHVGHVRWTWNIYYIEKSMRDTGSRSGKRKFGWTSVCKNMDEMDEFLVWCKFIFFSWLSICSVSRDCMDSLRDLKIPLRMVGKKHFQDCPRFSCWVVWCWLQDLWVGCSEDPKRRTVQQNYPIWEILQFKTWRKNHS
jgi:hypothetical protein